MWAGKTNCDQLLIRVKYVVEKTVAWLLIGINTNDKIYYHSATEKEF